MGVIYRKIWFDLWSNKVRTLLVVLSIAVGVFAIGTVFGMADQMITIMDQTWQEDMPQHLTMFLSTPVSRDQVRALRELPGIEGIEPAGAAAARYWSARDGQWHQALVWMRDDYRRETYDLYRLNEGVWPQGDGIGIEHMQAEFYKVSLGDAATLDVGGKEYVLPITGKIRHPYAPPPTIGIDLVYFFADAQGMARFGIPPGQFNTLLIRVTPASPEKSRQVAFAVKERLAGQNVEIIETQYQDPTKHWGREQMDPLILLMQIMAVASLVLSTMLVLNTVMALITQQTRQIGVLKAVGAHRRTIMQIYLGTVLIYGLLALGIAFPLGAGTAFYASKFFLSIFDIPHAVFESSTQAVILQLLAALVVPPLAALVPILNGARITVRQAIASYGIGTDFGWSRLDRTVQRVSQALLPVHYAVVLTNTFRRKRRLILTELVMIVAGALFLMLAAALGSTRASLDAEFGRRDFDLSVRFDQMQQVDSAVAVAHAVPEIEKAELVFGHPVSILRQGKNSQQVGVHSQLTCVPLENIMYRPLIVEGRWLQPGDDRMIVVGRDIAKDNQLKIGDVVTLDLGELGQSDWQIIGLHWDMSSSQLGATNIYAPRDAVWRATSQAGWGSFLVARTAQHDAQSVSAVADQLQILYRKEHMPVSEIKTGPQERSAMEKQFRQVVELLQLLVLLTALVGGIGLVGALSISVIERTKEIGVLRAIGASSRAVMGMFVVEALVQALLSWLIAVPLSLVGAPLLSNALGRMTFGTNLEYRYDYTAAVGWLALVLVVGLLASVLPARSASKIGVRQSLAYE